MTRCTTPGCLRKPEYPDQAKCREHRVKWVPEWVRYTREHRLAKEVTP